LFAKLTLIDIGVESKVVLVFKERSDFAYGESQFEEILEPLQISIKLAFLNGTLRLA